MPTVVGKDKSVYKRCTCKHCGSINEYTLNEVRTLWESMEFQIEVDTLIDKEHKTIQQTIYSRCDEMKERLWSELYDLK